ncbi:MAG TPA: hypothetical protein VFR24_11620 [Candidatus Angelobacter sp.]|nr:hypothetical protein [Candidatus Angelobacter sp.]
MHKLELSSRGFSYSGLSCGNTRIIGGDYCIPTFALIEEVKLKTELLDYGVTMLDSKKLLSRMDEGFYKLFTVSNPAALKKFYRGLTMLG